MIETSFHSDYTRLPKEELYSLKFKTSDDFILRSVAEENVLIPVGESKIFDNSIITLNETAAFLWKIFTKGITIQEAINKSLEEYESSLETIEFSVVTFVLENTKVDLLREVNEDEKRMDFATSKC